MGTGFGSSSGALCLSNVKLPMTAEPHLLIVEARYYQDIADELLQGAVAEITGRGASYETVTVPGVFEIPAAIGIALKSMDLVGVRRRFSGYLALGCVIRGETDHYKYVSDACVAGLMDLTTRYTLAVGFGVLTCDTNAQAMERAAVSQKNKGAEAAQAVFSMLDLKREFGFFPR